MKLLSRSFYRLALQVAVALISSSINLCQSVEQSAFQAAAASEALKVAKQYENT